jgi:hypothetical protein
VNTKTQQTLVHLKATLANIPTGAILDSQRQMILQPLKAVWPDIDGGDEGSTYPEHLDRAERLEWDSPFLTFVIERHGRKRFGSSRDDLHYWVVDLEKLSAGIEKIGWRKRKPRSQN